MALNYRGFQLMIEGFNLEVVYLSWIKYELLMCLIIPYNAWGVKNDF